MAIPNNRIELSAANVAKLIEILCIGKENALTSPAIQSALGVSPQQTSESTRVLIKHAIEKYHFAIASNSDGYWLIANVAELWEYLKSLDNRIEGILKRKGDVMEAWNIRNDQAV